MITNRSIRILKKYNVKDDSDLDKLEEALLGEADNQLHETYHIDCAFQGEEGLKMVKESLRKNEPYAVAFVDVCRPPGWDGIETVSRIWKLYPEIQIVICTVLILKKPFGNIEVRQLACALSKKWELSRIANLKMSELEGKVEARFRSLLENMPNIAVHGYGTDGIIHYWNKANEIIYGYTAKEAIGKNILELIIPPAMRSEVRKIIQRGAQTGETNRRDSRCFRINSYAQGRQSCFCILKLCCIKTTETGSGVVLKPYKVQELSETLHKIISGVNKLE
jgi:PAS domain S-box-containing protein